MDHCTNVHILRVWSIARAGERLAGAMSEAGHEQLLGRQFMIEVGV
jgi:hypothetical protein